MRSSTKSTEATSSIAVNRSAQPVQKSRFVFAECRLVPPVSTICRRRCCTKRPIDSLSEIKPDRLNAMPLDEDPPEFTRVGFEFKIDSDYGDWSARVHRSPADKLSFERRANSCSSPTPAVMQPVHSPVRVPT